MADTVRTISALQTLLADNTDGDISPQDVRDMLVSLVPQYGGLYVDTPAETSIATVSTPVKVAGATTTTGSSANFDSTTTDNRISYSGTATLRVDVSATIAMTSASNSTTFNMYIYHYDDSAASGAVVASSKVQRKIGTGADVGAAAVIATISMDTSDYVELWVENITDNSNWTWQGGILKVTGWTV